MNPLKAFTLTSVAVSLIFHPIVMLHAESPKIKQIENGNVQVQQQKHKTTIKASDNSIIEYSKFDIGKQHTVQFKQPSSSARVLNRVVSGNPSEIHGNLQANGQVYLMNRAGITIGKSAHINTSSFVAAAGNMSNQDFLNDINRFTDLQGDLINRGEIQADSAVHLLGDRVKNVGNIVVDHGQVTMSSGEEILLADPTGEDHVMVSIQKDRKQNSSEKDALVDDEQTVNLSSGDAAGVAIHQGGDVEAERVDVKGGDDGNVNITGTIDASRADQGGTINITGNVLTAHQGATLNADGMTGGGDIVFGGTRNSNSDQIFSASKNYIGPDFSLSADALQKGDGGTVIVRGQETRMHGTISARGGPMGGSGGFVEVSGKDLDVSPNDLEVAAPEGSAGTILLDPEKIKIAGGGPDMLTLKDQTMNVNFTIEENSDTIGNSLNSVEIENDKGKKTSIFRGTSWSNLLEAGVDTNGDGKIDKELPSTDDWKVQNGGKDLKIEFPGSYSPEAGDTIKISFNGINSPSNGAHHFKVQTSGDGNYQKDKIIPNRPFTVHENELEAANSNYELEATDSVLLSKPSDFSDDSGSGNVDILMNPDVDLTIRTINDGSQGHESGVIDLTGASSGETNTNFEFITRGSGSINISGSTSGDLQSNLLLPELQSGNNISLHTGNGNIQLFNNLSTNLRSDVSGVSSENRRTVRIGGKKSNGSLATGGNVILKNNLTVKGEEIHFETPVDGNAPAEQKLIAKTAKSGLTSFNGSVGTNNRLNTLITNSSGQTQLGADVLRVNRGVNFQDEVVPVGDTTIHGGIIEFQSILDKKRAPSESNKNTWSLTLNANTYGTDNFSELVLNTSSSSQRATGSFGDGSNELVQKSPFISLSPESTGPEQLTIQGRGTDLNLFVWNKVGDTSDAPSSYNVFDPSGNMLALPGGSDAIDSNQYLLGTVNDDQYRLIDPNAENTLTTEDLTVNTGTEVGTGFQSVIFSKAADGNEEASTSDENSTSTESFSDVSQLTNNTSSSQPQANTTSLSIDTGLDVNSAQRSTSSASSNTTASSPQGDALGQTLHKSESTSNDTNTSEKAGTGDKGNSSVDNSPDDIKKSDNDEDVSAKEKDEETQDDSST